MSVEVTQQKRSTAPVLLVAAAALLVMVLILQLGGVPAPPPDGSASAQSVPGNPNQLISNNLKLNDLLRLQLRTVPGGAGWILASSNTGPSWIGPYFTELGPDWFVLQDLVAFGGGGGLELNVQVPGDPALIGRQFVVQCAVIDPLIADIRMSNATHLTVAADWPSGKRVLLVRQTVAVSGMTNAAAQGTALANGLSSLGHLVTVADDVLPASLRTYDVILDCRFTTTPSNDETARLVEFLTDSGGVAFVAGPFVGCPAGQLRAQWVSTFLNTTLGFGVVVASGGNLSGMSVETIDYNADPNYLFNPTSVGGLPFDVSQEGGNFGPPGYATAGTPWVTGMTAIGPLVFGMTFRGEAATGCRIGGSVAVLFAGGPVTLAPSPQNPYPDLIFCNLAWFLDR